MASSDWCGQELADLASCYWLIPFHLSGSNPARWIWIGGHREGESVLTGVNAGDRRHRGLCGGRRSVATMQRELGHGEGTNGRSARRRTQWWCWRLRGRLLSSARLARGGSERQWTPAKRLPTKSCWIRRGKRFRGRLRNTGKPESKKWAAGTRNPSCRHSTNSGSISRSPPPISCSLASPRCGASP